MADVRDFTIVIAADAPYNTRRAAMFISDAVKAVTGKRLPLVRDDTPPSEYEIVIGESEREARFGIDFKRERAKAKSFEIRYIGTRLYITHLGTPDPLGTEYASSSPIDNGDYGLMYAAHYFCDVILGYRRVIPTLEALENKGEIIIDERCDYCYTNEFFSSHMPQKFDGAAMYFVPASVQPNHTQCNIFKTRSGKLVVLDGGFSDTAEHLVSMLEYLWEGEGVPVVSAWLFSHLHGDHFGAYLKINETEELASRIRIEKFYHDILPYEDYVRIGEGTGWADGVINRLLRKYEITGATPVRVSTKDRIKVDELEFFVVHTPSEVRCEEKKPFFPCNINDTSVVFRLDYNKSEQRILLLTDAEAACSINMLKNHKEELLCDVVQYGHHGGQSVSKECYEATGAKISITPQGAHGWFCDGGEAPSQTDLGIRRSLTYMCEQGITPENIYCDMFGTLSFKLPIKVR